ncbi:MAG: DNA-binding NarL/FixJ family response regulator [Verrucomicrobiales bacterium]|jgi:DNA-binding NarL/FixJ family response regulator
MKRILIVDDHPVMRFGLVSLINSNENLTVCGECGSACEAMEACQREAPDLALVDITLPDKNGLELVKDLRAWNEQLLILVVSMHEENVYAERALRAGARGYVMKEEAADKLVEAVGQVLAGGVYVSPKISARIVQQFADSGGSPESPIGRLTDRELEVFQQIGEGMASREIAAKLTISVRTVDAHRAHIKEKLGLRDATELMHQAVKWVETGSFA